MSTDIPVETVLPKELESLPDNHVDKLAALGKRNPLRPFHRRLDVAIDPKGVQIWKKQVATT